MPNALLTGVGRRRGIAAGIAAGLAEDGWDLALSYWHPYDQRVGHGGNRTILNDSLTNSAPKIDGSCWCPAMSKIPPSQPRW
jgi:hypothetical protein